MSTSEQNQLVRSVSWQRLAVHAVYALAASVAMMCAWRFTQVMSVPGNTVAIGVGWVSFATSVVAFTTGTVMAMQAVRGAPATAQGVLGNTAIVAIVLSIWLALVDLVFSN